MDEIKLKNTIAERIAFYRKAAGLTQLELAEKLNYSDKSVSKWERGEGLPDIVVLSVMAELFGVSVNDLISDEKPPRRSTGRLSLKDRILIPAMAIVLVLVAASIVYLILRWVNPDLDGLWRIFIYALPLCCIVAIVLLQLWGSLLSRFFCVTVLIWTSALAVYLTVSLQHRQEIFIIAGALQVLFGLWYLFKANFRRRKAKKDRQTL